MRTGDETLGDRVVDVELVLRAGRLAERLGWADPLVIEPGGLAKQGPSGPPIIVLAQDQLTPVDGQQIAALVGAGRVVKLLYEEPPSAQVATWLPPDVVGDPSSSSQSRDGFCEELLRQFREACYVAMSDWDGSPPRFVDGDELDRLKVIMGRLEFRSDDDSVFFYTAESSTSDGSGRNTPHARFNASLCARPPSLIQVSLALGDGDISIDVLLASGLQAHSVQVRPSWHSEWPGEAEEESYVGSIQEASVPSELKANRYGRPALECWIQCMGDALGGVVLDRGLRELAEDAAQFIPIMNASWRWLATFAECDPEGFA